MAVDVDEADVDADGVAAEGAAPTGTRHADASQDLVALETNTCTQTISSHGRLRQNLDLRMLYWPARQR